MKPCNQFFKDIWAGNGERLRLRVNDPDVSTHKEFGRRWEASAIGLSLLNLEDSPVDLAGAEVGLELWGGHPFTARKRFAVNGRRSYDLPDDSVSGGNCAYTFPSVPIDLRDLVIGSNAIQFSCDRGKGFWGHFIIDNLRLRLFYDNEHVDGGSLEVKKSVTFQVDELSDTSNSSVRLSIDVAARDVAKIERVDYFVRCVDYDTSGGRLPVVYGWQGYTRDREPAGHAGGATEPPFSVEWSAGDLPRQAGPVELVPLVSLTDGLRFFGRGHVVDRADGIGRSLIYGAEQLPTPFWSRDGREQGVNIVVPESAARSVTRAILHARFWDGVKFDSESPVSFNGERLPLLDGLARHDLVYSKVDIDPKVIRSGDNEFRVCAHTEHHGLEVLLPGPAIQLWAE